MNTASLSSSFCDFVSGLNLDGEEPKHQTIPLRPEKSLFSIQTGGVMTICISTGSEMAVERQYILFAQKKTMRL